MPLSVYHQLLAMALKTLLRSLKTKGNLKNIPKITLYKPSYTDYPCIY